MRFKLDENLDVRLASLFVDAGQEAKTVLEEGLSGRSDEAIYAICVAERRILVTLDLDFSNPIRFPPAATEGIVILRPPVLSSTRSGHCYRRFCPDSLLPLFAGNYGSSSLDGSANMTPAKESSINASSTSQVKM